MEKWLIRHISVHVSSRAENGTTSEATRVYLYDLNNLIQ